MSRKTRGFPAKCKHRWKDATILNDSLNTIIAVCDLCGTVERSEFAPNGAPVTVAGKPRAVKP